jgi:hypothetical protein
MTLVLDAGALIAYENGDRTVRAFLERAGRDGVGVRTTTGFRRHRRTREVLRPQDDHHRV